MKAKREKLKSKNFHSSDIMFKEINISRLDTSRSTGCINVYVEATTHRKSSLSKRGSLLQKRIHIEKEIPKTTIKIFLS